MLTTLIPPNGDHLNDEIIQGVESLMYFNKGWEMNRKVLSN